MRACNGCRKRKIKCDAATTNTWPCSACTRLKLVCVPPTIGQDGEFLDGPGGEPVQDIGGSSSASEASHNSFPVPPTYRDGNQPAMAPLPSYDSMGMYSQFVHAPPNQQAMYNDMRSPPMVMPHQSYQQPQMFQGQHPSLGTADRGVYAESEPSTAENLSDVLGELKIDETGIGRFPPFCRSAGHYPCANP